MDSVLKKDLVDKTNESIDSILSVPVEKISFDSQIPIDDDITDSNKVYKGNVSILFADMRNSTKFTDDNSAKIVVKVYRSFLKTITRAVRVCHGNIRDFIGDGVLAVFTDKEIDGEIVPSAEQAVSAGKTICTLLDYCLNPKLKDEFNTVVGYGIGICSGTVLATKVGMRGNEKKPDVENETGIIWIGSCTNYANKYCGVASSGEIVIDNATYAKLPCKQDWNSTQKVKGNAVYDCYVSRNNYLRIEINTKPVCVQMDVAEKSIGVNIFDTLKQRLDEYDLKIQTLTSLSVKLEEKEEELEEKEDSLRKKENGINLIDEQLKEREKLFDTKQYRYLSGIISHAHCKRAYTVECGEDFWDDQLKQAIEAGRALGKTKHDVEIELCYALADIYKNLNSWEKAYNYLCVQAQYHSWIHANTVKEYIIKSGHWARIKEIIDARVKKSVPYDLGKSLRECQETIRQLGY